MLWMAEDERKLIGVWEPYIHQDILADRKPHVGLQGAISVMLRSDWDNYSAQNELPLAPDVLTENKTLIANWLATLGTS